MKISFYGAAEMVTGSCFLLETNANKILIDCGMFQGDSNSDSLNRAAFDFNPSEIDYLLLTHAHIDHSGRIPLLIKRGFKGEILSTKATKELCSIMLIDSGYIQEMEVEWLNRKNLRANKPLVDPLYTIEDAEKSLEYFESIPYNEIINLSEEIRIRYKNAGHILGAAIIELWVKENNEEVKIVFSGDLGNKDIPIMKDPAIIDAADYLIVESTYGNKIHKEIQTTNLFLLDIITDTIERGGNIVIPSFAVGKTQELLYMLNALKESKFSKIKSIPVFLDSPLAINATKVFEANTKDVDSDTKELIREGNNPFDFPNLIFTQTAEESKEINFHEGSSIIVSASGMCEAGRIKHHLKHNLWRANSSIVFVGYQAIGTLGRRILEGEKKVKIFGEEIYVNCKIYNLDGLSGHADQKDIVEWISNFNEKPKKVFLVHGEKNSLNVLSHSIEKELNIHTQIVKLRETVQISPYTKKIIPLDHLLIDEQKYDITQFGNALESIKTDIDYIISQLRNKQVSTNQSTVNNIDLNIKNLNSEMEKLKKAILK